MAHEHFKLVEITVGFMRNALFLSLLMGFGMEYFKRSFL